MPDGRTGWPYGVRIDLPHELDSARIKASIGAGLIKLASNSDGS